MTNFVWVWPRGEGGRVDGERSNPVCVEAGQPFADVCHQYVAPHFAVVDTWGQWYEVRPEPGIGWVIVQIAPPEWVEETEEEVEERNNWWLWSGEERERRELDGL